MDVSYPTTHNKKLDTAIKKYINKTQSAFISEAEDIILEGTKNNDMRDWKPELVVGYTIHNYDTGGIVSIEFNTYEYL
jgi:Deacetylase PdaC